MPRCPTRAGQLYFDTVGDGAPVLLIHGFTNFGMGWAPQLPALLAAGRRIIVPDLRGHGRSGAAPSPAAVTDLASDMVDLLGHLDIARAAVCGLSLGGMVAQRFAADHPDRVSALVVACSTASANDEATRAAVAQWVEVLEQPDGPLQRLDQAWPWLTNEAFRASASGRATYEGWRRTLATVSGASLADVARGLALFDMTAELSAIEAPTLVIAGEKDRLFPPAAGQAIAEAVGGSAYRVLPGAGHLANLDSPDLFNGALLDFLAAHAE